MKVYELLELLQDLCEVNRDMEVNIAYQPRYPLCAKAASLKVAHGEAYICESAYGGNGYAPRRLFDDNESGTYDIYEGEGDED